jgi:hypothetical protein
MRLPLRLPLLALATLLVPAMQGCAAATLVETPAPAPGEYVFEVDYANYAWAPTHTGLVVDASGDVWSFDYGERAGSDPQHGITGAEWAATYAHGRRLVRHLDPAEVAVRAAQITAAAAGPLGPEVGKCADAGVVRFHAFRYQAATDSYEPVLLHQAGDVARRNLAPQAGELTAWLRGLSAQFGMTECEP